MAPISIWGVSSQDNGSYEHLGVSSQDNGSYEHWGGGGGSARKIKAPMGIWGISSEDKGSCEHFGGVSSQVIAPMSI